MREVAEEVAERCEGGELKDGGGAEESNSLASQLTTQETQTSG